MWGSIFSIVTKVLRYKGWVTYRFSYAMRHNDTSNMSPLHTFYSSSNALFSSDESIQIKHFKHHTFIGMCSPFTWFNLQIMIFCLWRVLNRLAKCANVRYHKKQVFLWFTINSQSKLKKFSTLFLRYLLRKTRYEI